MIYEYDELKESIQEDFDRFYEWEFNEKEILPATLDEYRYGGDPSPIAWTHQTKGILSFS